MLRLLHNRSIVKYFLAALGIAFAFYFAWSFYPFGEWVGKHFLQDAPGGTQVLGIVLQPSWEAVCSSWSSTKSTSVKTLRRILWPLVTFHSCVRSSGLSGSS